jgi:predicted amidohydrolase YtcJ
VGLTSTLFNRPDGSSLATLSVAFALEEQRKSILKYSILWIAMLMLAACVEDSGMQIQPADSVFINGRIYTVDAARPWAEAVAIRDGKYVYVGDAEGTAAHVGGSTQVVDLQGKMVMPGINETHSHSWQGGRKELYECNFPFTATPEEIAIIVAGCVASNTESEWITGGQWTSDFFTNYDIGSPREWLDAISGDKAIYFQDDATHNAWVNSKALEIAGIGRETPDPPGGTYVRDENGVPNGIVLETAKPVIESFIPAWTHEQNVASLAKAVELANMFGLTGIHEARTPPDISAAYQQLDREGRLTAHAITNLQTPRGRREETFDVAPLVEISEQYRSEHVHTRFAKIFLDGVPTASHTAVMLEPYLTTEESPEATRGHLLIPQDVLTEDLTNLDAAGFTVKMHAAGDGAVRAALDAIDQVRKTNGRSGLRHEIAHAGYIHPDDGPRFAALNVTVDLSPYLWYPRPIIDSIIGAVGERAKYYWPIKDLLATGVNVASGSDWPSVAESMNPWPAIEAMVTRRNPLSDSDEALWPEQAITLDQALKIFTLNGALASRLEHKTGLIKAGKSADLIVLNQNLFEVPIERVSETIVLMTFFEGKLVYSTAD